MGFFKEDDTQYELALELVCLYYLKTEIFDCNLTDKFDKDGISVIVGHRERSLSNAYASKLYFELQKQINIESFLKAKKYFRNINLNVKNLKEQYKIITGKDYETF
jgi:hypothetical protein